MAWEWSHTHEAYRNVQNNISDLSTAQLRIVWAEWKAYEPSDNWVLDSSNFDEGKYYAGLDKAIDTPDDILADDIWTMASDLATCDNGGFNAWICPYGCHTVSFDRENEDE